MTTPGGRISAMQAKLEYLRKRAETARRKERATRVECVTVLSELRTMTDNALRKITLEDT